MDTQSNRNINSFGYALEATPTNGNDYALKSFSKEDMINAFEKIVDVKNLLQQGSLLKLAELLTRLPHHPGKKSFLVFKNNKYVNVLTEKLHSFISNMNRR